MLLPAPVFPRDAGFPQGGMKADMNNVFTALRVCLHAAPRRSCHGGPRRLRIFFVSAIPRLYDNFVESAPLARQSLLTESTCRIHTDKRTCGARFRRLLRW